MNKVDRKYVLTILVLCFGTGIQVFAAPIITNLHIKNITSASAEVLWDTDIPATSQVLFGSDGDSLAGFTPIDHSLVTNHDVVLTLTPNTSYYCRVNSLGSDGSLGSMLSSSAFHTLNIDTNSPFDFIFQMVGPHNVNQGFPIFVQLNPYRISGPDTRPIYLHVEGLPAGATIDFPPSFYNPGFKPFSPTVSLPYEWMSSYMFTVGARIQTQNTTPVGDYDVTFTLFDANKIRKQVYRLSVQPPPVEPIRPSAVSYPPIPNLSKWEGQMLTYGKKSCNLTTIQKNSFWEGGVWYYDGMRVFQQIADYTGDPSWNTCSDYVRGMYRDSYVLKGNGLIPGWRVFPHGMKMDYERTGDPLSREGTILLGKNAAYGPYGGGISDALIRETAYIIQAYLWAEHLGAPHNPLLERAVNFGLGHLDTYFVSGTSNYKLAFMAGLMMAALIEYDEAFGDSRILPAVCAACDWLWSNAWVPADHSFWYNSTNPQPQKGAPDLNLLIAPAFAWAWQKTGDPKYQIEGDQIFAGGVDGAYLDGGKQFSQNYRWSFDYVRWRSHYNADTYTITGPTETPVGILSREYRVTPNGYYKGTITVNSSQGTLTPNTLTWSGGSQPQFFKFTPTTVGSAIFTASSSPSLSNPDPFVVTVVDYTPVPAATTYTLSGPTLLIVNQGSSDFTLTPDGVLTGSIKINDGGKGGNIHSPLLTWTGHSLARSFNYTPVVTGLITLSATNDQNLVNPPSMAVLVVEATVPASGFSFVGPGSVTLGRVSSVFTVTPLGGWYAGTVTPTDDFGGGIFSPSNLSWSNSVAPQTFTYTPSSLGAKVISISSNPDLPMPPSIHVDVSGASPGPSTGPSTDPGLSPSINLIKPGQHAHFSCQNDSVQIVNKRGIVKDLSGSRASDGSFSFDWDITDKNNHPVAAGVYRIRTGTCSTDKLIVVK